MRARLAGVFVCVIFAAAACASAGESAIDVLDGADAVEVQAPVPTTAPVAVTVPPAASPTVDDVAEVAPAPTALVLPTTTPAPTPAPEPTAVVPTSAPEPAAAAVATSPAATAAPTPAGSQAVLAANGGEVFTLNCARCHAENGTGTAQYSGLIGVGSRYSAATMFQELKSGHPVTFGFADKLSDEEIASVVAYVKAAFP